MNVDPNKDSWLSKNVRPIVMLIAFSTISIVIIFNIEVLEWLLKSYVGWTGVMVTFYFGIREVIKYVARKK